MSNSKKVLPGYYADLKDESITTRVIAKRWAIAKSTVHDDRVKMRKGLIKPDTDTTGSHTEEVSSDGSRSVEFIRDRPITLEDARDWVRSTGDDPDDYDISVRSIAYGEGMSSNRMAAVPKRKKGEGYDPKVAAQDVFNEAKNIKVDKPLKRATTARSLIVGLSDLQLGKVDENGNSATTVAHVQKAMSNVYEYLKENEEIDHVYVVDGGDIIEGFTNVKSQTFTNDISLTEQVRLARRLVWSVLQGLYELGCEVTYVTVPSNHCQVRSSVGRDAVIAGVWDDWGIEISFQLEDLAEMSGAEINFLRPERYEENLAFELPSGTVVGVVHGHQFTNADRVKDWRQKADHGRYPVSQADILLFGHHHNFSIRQSGNNRWAICLPSSDNGSSWFRNKAGESAQRGILIFENSVELPWTNLQIL